MQLPTIKICGITSAADARRAAEAGATALGLNFFRGPRQIDIATARDIAAALAEHTIALIGLFASLEAYEGATGLHGLLQGVQLYSAPTELHAPAWWQVVPWRGAATREALAAVDGRRRGGPAAILLDSWAPGLHGGTGLVLPWAEVAICRRADSALPPLIVAGGLTARNVAKAIAESYCDGVDVASGVEVPGQPGKKDAAHMRDFVAAARAAFAARAVAG